MPNSTARPHKYNTFPSSPMQGGNGATSSCTIFGHTWTPRSCLRFLIGIILVNVIIAVCYLISPLQILQMRQAVRLVQDVTTAHPDTIVPLISDLRRKDANDKNKTSNLFSVAKIPSQRSLHRSDNFPNSLSDDWHQSPLVEIPALLNRANGHVITSPLKAKFDENNNKYKQVQDVESNESEDRLAGMYSIFEQELQRNNKRNSHGTNLEDEDHPQYSSAFPRHTKPMELLNWTRSSESWHYFQQIDDEEAWVYSAYFDNRQDVMVKAFGITRRNLVGVIFCRFYDFQEKFLTYQKGRMRLFKDSHGSRSSAMEILCPVDSKMQPKYVRVTFSKNTPSTSNQIEILYPQVHRRNFTVCFPPFHSNYGQTSQLVQTIELNRVLGADFFYVYNFSMTNEVSTVLSKYQSEGLVTVMPWPLPNLDSWYYGQLLAINDCIYRNMGVSRYVVVSDTDEVIVPHIHSKWTTLLDNVVKHPWQRDDEFLDPYLKPVQDRFNAHRSNEESDENKWSRRRNIDDGSREWPRRDNAKSRKYPKILSTRRNPLNPNFSGSGSRETNRFTRNKEKFPSRSVDSSPSRQLLSLNDELEFGDIENPVEFKFGSFSFRCVFFTVKMPRRESMKDLEPFAFSQEERDLFSRMPMCPMLHLMRTDFIFEHSLRSKLIVLPELVVQCGIHKVVAHVDGYRTAYVEPEIALLHHYRAYKINNCNTLDLSVMRFKNLFYQGLKLAVEKFSSIVFSS